MCECLQPAPRHGLWWDLLGYILEGETNGCEVVLERLRWFCIAVECHFHSLCAQNKSGGGGGTGVITSPETKNLWKYPDLKALSRGKGFESTPWSMLLLHCGFNARVNPVCVGQRGNGATSGWIWAPSNPQFRDGKTQMGRWKPQRSLVVLSALCSSSTSH